MRRKSHAPLPRLSLPPSEGRPVVGPSSRTVAASPLGRRVVRARPKVDSTEEVEVEDILLEAYLDDAPPASRVSRSVPPVSETAPDPVDLLLASTPPPPVRASLRPPPLPPSPPSSARAPIPTPTPWAELPSIVAQTFANAATGESPSVAPVVASVAPVVASSAPPPVVWPSAWASSGSAFAQPSGVAPRVVAAAKPSRVVRVGRAFATLAWSVALLVVGALVGGILVLRAYPTAASARAFDAARSRLHELTRPVEPARAAAFPAPPPSPSSATPPSSATSSAPPSVPVAALPSPSIPAGQGRLTLPAYARGHRVFLDGVALPVSEGELLVRCGRHVLRIGSTGKARDVDVPCGAALVLR